jgi:hypothetical protein
MTGPEEMLVQEVEEVLEAEEAEEAGEERLPLWAAAWPSFRSSVIKYQSHRNTIRGEISNGCWCKEFIDDEGLAGGEKLRFLDGIELVDYRGNWTKVFLASWANIRAGASDLPAYEFGN